MDLVFDIETDDIAATVIHCIVCQDPESGEIFKFKPDQIAAGCKFLADADTLIGHNIVGFDIPVIKKLTGVDLAGKKLIDTLVLSRLFNPIREGGHSLGSWGYKLKYPKINFEEYLTYTPEMLKYCVRDVQLNTMVFKALSIEVKQFSKDSVDLEHDVARIMKQQEENGFKFDSFSAEILLAELREKKQKIEDEVHNTFKPKWVDDKLVTPYIKKDGTLSKRGLTDDEYKQVYQDTLHPNSSAEPFMRRKLVDFNLGSRKQIGEYLVDFGWKPNRFTPTGQPIVDEKTLEQVTHIHEASLIATFLLLQKRIAHIDSWVKAVKEDGRIHGFVIPNGAITGRMTHRNPNTAQIPSLRQPYGKECRACWTVDEGNVLLGIDASGLEIRMLAHYMKDEEFTNEILNGDIHSANQKLAGLKSRDQAKTFIYALMYGAGDAKLGSVVGGNKKDGTRSRQLFFDNKPSFKHLRDRVTRASARGHIKAIDGRKLFIRNAHSALNTLLQGAGAIVMKQALVIFDKHLKESKLTYKFVANIHDEWQMEVPKQTAGLIGAMGVRSIVEAGQVFKMNCPLDGEYKHGSNWSETH
jgi:DNA polymerase-1